MSSPRVLNNRGKTIRTGLQKLGIYNGNITAAGAISNGPSGWTGGAPASSVFTVTHNLNLTASAYDVKACIEGATKGALTVKTRGANSFTVETWDLATPTLADLGFSFTLTRSDGE